MNEIGGRKKGGRRKLRRVAKSGAILFLCEKKKENERTRQHRGRRTAIVREQICWAQITTKQAQIQIIIKSLERKIGGMGIFFFFGLFFTRSRVCI